MTEKRVTIVGGGIAGMSAALRLAERGYDVTLYEKAQRLGGNLGAVQGDESAHAHDVYPHMYLPSYRNFFALAEEVLGVPREQNFAALTNVKRLGQGDFPNYKQLTNTFSPNYLFKNLFSGVLSPADMFIFGYLNYDLLAESLHPSSILDELSVNGFAHSRPYMTPQAAEVLDAWIDLVWGVPSYLTSATSYQQYLASGFVEPEPALWFFEHSTYTHFIEPFAELLETKGVEVRCGVGATRVVVEGGRVCEIEFANMNLGPHARQYVPEDHWVERIDDTHTVMLAVPAPALNDLVRAGETGSRIVDVVPELANLSRMRTAQLPVLHLYFNDKLQDIPREPTSFPGARYGIAFTDVSQNWVDEPVFVDHTVMALSASDVDELPGPDDEANAVAMLQELAKYIPLFEIGDAWGSSDQIDWDRTHYASNYTAQLFINEVGSNAYRPQATYAPIENLFFGGDFAQSEVGMATVEAAVVGGLRAAHAVVESIGLGDPVEVVQVQHLPAELFVWLRWALGPAVYIAKAISVMTESSSESPTSAIAEAGQVFFSSLPETLSNVFEAARGESPQGRAEMFEGVTSAWSQGWPDTWAEMFEGVTSAWSQGWPDTWAEMFEGMSGAWSQGWSELFETAAGAVPEALPELTGQSEDAPEDATSAAKTSEWSDMMNYLLTPTNRLKRR